MLHNTTTREIDWLIEHGFTSAPTQYRLYGRRFLQVWWPNQQCQSTEEGWLVIQTDLSLTRLTSPCYNTDSSDNSPSYSWPNHYSDVAKWSLRGRTQEKTMCIIGLVCSQRLQAHQKTCQQTERFTVSTWLVQLQYKLYKTSTQLKLH